MTAVRLRPPDLDDAAELAAILNMAGGGVISHLLDGLIPGTSGESLFAAAMQRDQGLYSADNTLLLEKQGRIAAVLAVCPAGEHAPPPALNMFVSKKKLNAVLPMLQAAVPGSLHMSVFWLDADLCEEAEARMLLFAAEERCKALGLGILGVFCRQSETREIDFFTAMGFSEHTIFASEELIINGNAEGGRLLRKDLP